jgi:signal transduction histidine kinase
MAFTAIPRSVLRLRRHPKRIFGLCAAAVLVLGLLDLVSPLGLIPSVLFLAPILIAMRFNGRRAAELLCFCSAAFWLLRARFHANPGVPLWLLHWQVLERLVFFVVVVVISDVLLADAKRSGRMLTRERRSSKTKSEMLSLVSHEINNSMTMIGLAIKHLEAGGEGGVSREDACSVIERNVSRMRIAAQNFLSEARMASGPLKLEMTLERLEDVVADVVLCLRPLSDAKKISASWSVVPGDLRVPVDRVAFAVALTNLVGNAIKYTPDLGRVVVDVRLSEGPPRRAVVGVSDTGIGIAPEDQARVLAGFQRTEAGARKASGFGLGLKIAYEIISAHRGELTIVSSPGKGSLFSFSIPA